MRLNNSDLYDFLKEKNINKLYHANTVSTTCTFLEQNGLMSRGAVENKGLYQTTQSSDVKDKEVNVWNDIFLDTADLHRHFNRENYYGPVLFELSSHLILNEELDVWITKDNPIYWNENMTDEERYFISVDELKEKWDSIHKQKKMITIRNVNKPILFDYVNKVLVDNPQVEMDKLNIFNVAKDKLKASITNNHLLKGKFFTREECGYCWCKSNYLNQKLPKELEKLFL